MGLRIAPSAIVRYLRSHNTKWLVDAEGIRWGLPVRIPNGAGSAISLRLIPILEQFVDETHKLALQLLDEENEFRRGQSLYRLKNPRAEHYDKAARLVVKNPLRYIFQDNLRGYEVSKGVDETEPNEPEGPNDPTGD